MKEKGFHNVYGIDISDKNIETARMYSDQLKMNNVEFRKGNVEEVPLPKLLVTAVSLQVRESLTVDY